MNDVDAIDGVAKRATRRRHSARFKVEVLEACRQPDAFAAAIARLYNLNANVVPRWRADNRKAASPKLTDVSTLPLAQQALQRIGELFKVEADIRGKPPNERMRVRHARTGPMLGSLRDWLNTTLSQVSAKSPCELDAG